MKTKIFVFVRGGLVEAITDEAGAGYPMAYVIDYDRQENGACPVCSSPDPTGETLAEPCKICGYDPKKNTDGMEAIRAASTAANPWPMGL